MATAIAFTADDKDTWNSQRNTKSLKVNVDKTGNHNKMFNNRNRNDSGCVEDLAPPSSVTSSCSSSSASSFYSASHLHHDEASSAIYNDNHDWTTIIDDWSAKTHSILGQEVARMMQMTQMKKKQLETAENKADKEFIARKWREEMEGMMEISVDLIQCVANDVIETVSASSESSSSFTSQDLGKIIEEELFDKSVDGQREEQDEKKIFLVMTKKKKNRKQRNHNRKKDSKKCCWIPRNTFTITVDELQQKKKGGKEKQEEDVLSSRSWEWKKDLDSPIVWNEDENMVEESPEDIFKDWLRLMKKLTVEEKKNSKNNNDVDINEVFWNISMDEGGHKRRTRRISQVLENLPFDDQPDVFGDRFELLEPSAAASNDIGKKWRIKASRKYFKRKKPQRSYWNIFYEWKGIFKEEINKKKKKKNNPKRKRTHRKKGGQLRKKNNHPEAPNVDKTISKPPLTPVKRIFEQHRGSSTAVNYCWYHFPKRYVLLPQQQEPKKKRKINEALPPDISIQPRKSSIVTIEEYFNDFLCNFDESNSGGSSNRRRSREYVDDGDETPLENIPKRRRTTTNLINQNNGVSSYRNNWEIIRLESSKTFDMITSNIEAKIREAFDVDAAIQSAINQPIKREEESFEGTGAVQSRRSSRVERLFQQQQQQPRDNKFMASRKEFERLRAQVRKLRNDAAAIRKNEESPTVVLDIFKDWRKWNMKEEEEITNSPINKMRKSHAMMKKSLSLSTPFKWILAAEKMKHKIKTRRNNAANSRKKFVKQLMNKCHAKQPIIRGSNGGKN